MRWIEMEWKAWTEETITNCFLHCFKHEPGRIVEVEESGGVDEIREEMENITADHGESFTRAGIDALLHPDEEDDVVESISFEELGLSAAGLEDVVAEEPEKDVSLETDGLYTVEEELKGLAVANADLVRFGLLNMDLLAKIRGWKRKLRAQKLAKLNQTTMTDHFKSSSK